MTFAHKSFVLSLLFHTFMGSLAFVLLTQMRTPPPLMKIETKQIMLVSLSDSLPMPKRPKMTEVSAAIAPPPKITPVNPITSVTPLPLKTPIPQPNNVPPAPSVAAPTVSVVSAPTIPQRSIQHTPASDAVQTPPKSSIDLSAEKRSFFASLRSSIQNHLRYPTAARRRGMEGEIGVRFTLNNDGTIGSISVQSGESIFHNAAKAAIASASGIDVPKNLTASLPMEIDLTLEFKLKS